MPSAAAAGSGPALPVSVVVAGTYFEASLGGEVGYEGVMTLYWVQPSDGSDDWTVDGTLVARGVDKRTGESFTYLGVCNDCFAMAAGSAIVMTKPVWAFEAGGSIGFQGSILVALELPLGAARPRVNSAALASR